jgi:hypothetical protein
MPEWWPKAKKPFINGGFALFIGFICVVVIFICLIVIILGAISGAKGDYMTFVYGIIGSVITLIIEVILAFSNCIINTV